MTKRPGGGGTHSGAQLSISSCCHSATLASTSAGIGHIPAIANIRRPGSSTRIATEGTSFIGGINLNPHSLVTSDHRGDHHNHDVYVEVAGPAVADVHHNFVQRWNEASERARDDGRWGERGDADLDYPTHVPRASRRRPSCRSSVPRTRAGMPTAIRRRAARRIRSHLGERTNLDQYLRGDPGGPSDDLSRAPVSGGRRDHQRPRRCVDARRADPRHDARGAGADRRTAEAHVSCTGGARTSLQV